MDVCVTGASGFIGRHLVSALRDRHNVVTVQRGVSGDYEFDELSSKLERCRVLVHLAGVNRGTTGEILAGNIRPLFSILRAVEHLGTRLAILHASSLQVYGFSRHRRIFSEQDVPAPTNEYGASKLLAECILRGFSERGLTRVVSMRCGNVYGPGCRPDYNSVVATYHHRIRSGKPLIVSGTGDQERDFIFVDDVVDALVRGIDYSLAMKTSMDVLNVCSGTPVSIRSLAELMIDVYDSSSQILYDGQSKSEQSYLIGDPGRAYEVMRFKTRFDIEDGVRRLSQEEE